MIQDVDLSGIPLFIAPVICVAVAVVILVFAVINFARTKEGRGYVVFKALASLVAWFFASWGVFFMVFLVIYSGAHAEDRADGGSLTGVSLIVLDLLYALAGCGLALWVRHRRDDKVTTLFT